MPRSWACSRSAGPGVGRQREPARASRAGRAAPRRRPPGSRRSARPRRRARPASNVWNLTASAPVSAAASTSRWASAGSPSWLTPASAMTKHRRRPPMRAPADRAPAGSAAPPAAASAIARSAASSMSIAPVRRHRQTDRHARLDEPAASARRCVGVDDVERAGEQARRPPSASTGVQARRPPSSRRDATLPGWLAVDAHHARAPVAIEPLDRRDAGRRGRSAATSAGRGRRRGTVRRRPRAPSRAWSATSTEVAVVGGERGRSIERTSRPPRLAAAAAIAGSSVLQTTRCGPPARSAAASRARSGPRGRRAGCPPTVRRFLPGMRWLPPRAGIRNRTPAIASRRATPRRSRRDPARSRDQARSARR